MAEKGTPANPKGATVRTVPKMRSHTFREYDDEWNRALAAAAYFREDISEVIRRGLRAYVELHSAAKEARK